MFIGWKHAQLEMLNHIAYSQIHKTCSPFIQQSIASIKIFWTRFAACLIRHRMSTAQALRSELAKLHICVPKDHKDPEDINRSIHDTEFVEIQVHNHS